MIWTLEIANQIKHLNDLNQSNVLRPSERCRRNWMKYSKTSKKKTKQNKVAPDSSSCEVNFNRPDVNRSSLTITRTITIMIERETGTLDPETATERRKSSVTSNRTAIKKDQCGIGSSWRLSVPWHCSLGQNYVGC